ncbi:MAG: 3D domain-containing protein [Actinobacteria bacterium]|nr:3D domain-containing protein [Actinomycetota bacterium]
MLKKYNIAINILFWIMIASITAFIALALIKPEYKLNAYLFGEQTQEESALEKEPVVVTEYKEIEKKVDWYYFIATAYSKNDAAQGTDDKTATGETVRSGIIAVDPKIIPYGTIIEIKDMGYFVAEDCGSKIKGNRIDIYFDSKKDAKEFGRQGLWIRFVVGSNIQLAAVKASTVAD